MAGKRASIRDVAQASGVSLTTVSLVLNGNDQRISEATRARVRKAIGDLGYTPSRLARGLPNRRANMLAILLPALHNAFADVYFGELIGGIYEAAADRGYRILLEVARRSYVQKREYMRLLDDCSVDGIFFCGSTEEHEWVGEFDGTDRPLMIVNNLFDRWDLHHVLCDYASAGRLAAEYLVGLGHRRIGHVSGPVDMVQTARELTDAFVGRLEELGVRLGDQLVMRGEFQAETAKLACDELLAREPGLTAVFCANDKMAMGVYQSVRESGREVGEDVAVMGCDDIPLASLAQPGLTTVSLNFGEVGRRACGRMIDLIESKGRSEGGGVSRVSERVPVHLVERSSTNGAAGRVGRVVADTSGAG